MKTLDAVFRVVAALIGVMYLAGLSVFIRGMTALDGLLMLSNFVLMVAFVISRYGKSVSQLCLFGVVLILVLVDGATKALPSMRDEGYPSDVLVFYAIEYLLIAWFGIRHLLLRSRSEKVLGSN